MPVTKQIPYDSIYKESRTVKFLQKGRTVVARGWREGGSEELVLTATEFWFCKMKRVLKIDGGGDRCTI